MQRNHTTVTYSKKKKLEKPQAILKANLASLLSSVHDNDNFFSHIKLGMYSYKLHNTTNVNEISNNNDNYGVISITNLVMEDLYEKNIAFHVVCAQYKAASILASINVCDDNLILNFFV